MRLTNLIIYFSFAFLFLAALTFQAPVLLSPSHPVEIDDADYEEIEARYGITFPIPELDNCTTYSECLGYCEDPVNYAVCTEYAREKGFYEEKIPEEKLEILERAKEELGCDSFASCRAFCEQEANYESCHQFAEDNQLSGGYESDPTAERILEQAKEFLGCDSYESCSSYCQDPANYDSCSEFADQVGIRGGEENSGPGGCTTETTCNEFCSDPGNFELCNRYTTSVGGDFEGPGGCNSEESCRAYCEENWDECRYFGSEVVDPEAYCQLYPEKCERFGRDVTSDEFERYCLENPEECEAKLSYDPEIQCNKTPQCNWENNTCACYTEFVDREYDPATECVNYGCTWTGITCQCSESGGTYYSPDDYGVYCVEYPEKCQDYSDPKDSEAECTQYPDCIWSGNTCNCTPGAFDGVDPVEECTAYGCTWTGNDCQCDSSDYTPSPDSGGDYGNPATECANYGCDWTGTTCECFSSSEGDSGGDSGAGGSDPATECANYGCNWTGSTCDCPSSGGETAPESPPEVYGVSTVRDFFQELVQLIFGR